MVQEMGHACHVQEEAEVLSTLGYCYLQTGKQDSHAAVALHQGKQTLERQGYQLQNLLTLTQLRCFRPLKCLSLILVNQSTNLGTHQLDAFSEKTTCYQILLWFQTIFQHTTEFACMSTQQAHYLSYRILLLLGTFCLVLRPQLELLLFLFKINQIPLIFQSSLPPLPKLQEKCNCNLEMLKYS